MGRGWAFLGPVLVAVLALGCTRAPTETRPSIVVISIDTLRADHVGFLGYPRDTTPFLDSLAEESVVFEQAYTPWPGTLAAHMTMLTGRHAHEHGLFSGDLALSPEIPLLAERLHGAGYRTLGFYFPGWIHERFGFARGFDHFESHADAEEAEQHLNAALEQVDPSQPTFLFLHLFDVHSKPLSDTERELYRSPAPFQDMFLSEDDVAPDRSTNEAWKLDEVSDPHVLSGIVAHYDGGIRYVDTKLASMVGALERRGLLDNAYLIVTADHGESLGKHGPLRGHGGYFQEGLHIPLLVRPPGGATAGSRRGDTVFLTDIVPTALEAARLPLPPDLPGRSLLADPGEARTVFGIRPSHFEYFLRGSRKLVRLPRKSLELDFAADPDERRPQPIPAEELETVRLEALEGRGDGVLKPAVSGDAAPQAELDKLRGLGYGE